MLFYWNLQNDFAMNDIHFTPDSVTLYERTKITVIKYEDIVYFATDRPYLVVSTLKNQTIYMQVSLSKIISMLPDYFCQCSQSVIINLFYVSQYEERDHHGFVHLSTSDTFKVSRRCRQNVKNRIMYFNQSDTHDNLRAQSVVISL